MEIQVIHPMQTQMMKKNACRRNCLIIMPVVLMPCKACIAQTREAVDTESAPDTNTTASPANMTWAMELEKNCLVICAMPMGLLC